MSITLLPAATERSAKLARARWRGRTDLIWLARSVLGYKQIEDEVHGPLCNFVQKFPAPPEDQWTKWDVVNPKYIEYKGPFLPMEQLPSSRRRLILDSRSFFKTTINVICHTVQWLLNYPDATVLIVHAKQEVAEDILGEIKSKFLFSPTFRDLYPDYCPAAKDSGNRGRFTVANRVNKSRKEPSVGIASIETAVSGYHYDVIKFTDIVDRTNSMTADQCKKVIGSFGMFRNVLVSPDRWIDVEGTCYHTADLYNQTIENEQKLVVDQRRWKVYLRGCYKKDTGGRPYAFSPEERELRDLLDDKGNKVSWFPKKWPVHELESMRKDATQTEFLFNAQQLNDPVNSESAVFPVTLFRVKSAGIEDPKHNDLAKVPIAYYTTTVDTAETEGRGSDFSAIVTCGWDANGRCYVVDARHGRFMPDELINQLFDVYRTWGPKNVRIEETGYVRGLKTSIRRFEDLSGVYLPLLFMPRESSTSKPERILLTLQPWYQRGEIFFSEKLTCLDQFRKQLTSFPKGAHDDLIDALSDQFQAREWLGREVSRPSTPQQFEECVAKVMENAQKLAVQGLLFGENTEDNAFFASTGGL